MLTRLTSFLTAAVLLLACPTGARAQVRLIGDPVDVSEDFTKPENVYFVAGRVTELDTATGSGKIEWKRHRRRVSLDFNHAPGTWIDYEGGAKYDGGRWHTIKAGVLPVVLLVRGGAIVPHAAVAQHTGAIDWKNIELRVYGGASADARGLFALPDGELHTLTGVQARSGFALREDPLKGRVTLQVRSAAAR